MTKFTKGMDRRTTLKGMGLAAAGALHHASKRHNRLGAGQLKCLIVLSGNPAACGLQFFGCRRTQSAANFKLRHIRKAARQCPLGRIHFLLRTCQVFSYISAGVLKRHAGFRPKGGSLLLKLLVDAV